MGGPEEVALQVVTLFPALEVHQHYPQNSTRKKVVDILNRQICEGKIIRSRGGKISRKRLAEQLKLAPTAMTVFLGIIESYERQLGPNESSIEARIPEFRRWLEQQIRQGSLLTRDGKVSRKQLGQNFGISNLTTCIVRYSRLRALFDEFDERVRATKYQPNHVAEKLDALREALADPPIRKDLLNIDQQKLAEAIPLKVTELVRPPYIQLIREAEGILRERLSQDPLLALVASRVFQCKTLVEQGWSYEFACRIKTGFERIYRTSSKDTAKVAFACLCELLIFVAKSDSSACVALYQGLSCGRNVRDLTKEFTLATQLYRDSLVERYERSNSRNTKLRSTSSVIKRFSSQGILPPLELGLIQFREHEVEHLRSVAEITAPPSKEHNRSEIDDYLSFATSMLRQAADLRQIEVASSDQDEFTRNLRAELANYGALSAENPAKIILQVLTKRLDLLRTAAEKVTIEARRRWDQGRKLLEIAKDMGDDWEAFTPGSGINDVHRKALLRRYFPNDPEKQDQGIANLLRVIVETHDSIYPSSNLGGAGQFFAKRALEYGGKLLLQSYLLPSKEAVTATLILYLLDSGSNVAVARTLHRDSIEDSEEPNHTKITGYKARARGKPIFVTLPNQSFTISSLCWLRDAFRSTSKVAKGDENQLFLQRVGDGLKLIEEWSFRAQFKQLIDSIPELSGTSLTPNMLRPSILLKVALETDGNTGVSRAVGQHSAQIHEGYVNKYPIRYLRDTDIRLFQYSIETVVVHKLDDVHEFLNVDRHNMARRVEAVMRTGLGTLCADRYGRPGSGGEACQSLDCVKGCPQLILIA